MKKFLIILIFLTISQFAYPFWIWSPKKGEWKNAKNAPSPAPQLQIEKANVFYANADFKRAYKEYRKVIRYYPDSIQAAQAQLRIGQCLEALGHHYKAYQQYWKGFVTYPNSPYIEETIAKSFNIGKYFLEKERTKFFGVEMPRLNEHPSIEIFTKIANEAPSSPYAPEALYSLGILYISLANYAEAKQTFERLIENYPASKWVEAAQYHYALAGVKSSLDPEYDQSITQDARQQLEKFLSTAPATEVSEKASEELDQLKEKEAEQKYQAGEFYEKLKKLKSAKIYYQQIVDHYPNTSYANRAQEKLEALKDVSQ